MPRKKNTTNTNTPEKTSKTTKTKDTGKNADMEIKVLYPPPMDGEEVKFEQLGVLYTHVLKDCGIVNGEQRLLFNIGFTRDFKDPVLNSFHISIRRPIPIPYDEFVYECILETLKSPEYANWLRHRPDLGPGYFETPPKHLQECADEVCHFVTIFHKYHSLEHMERLLEENGIDFDDFYMFPEFEDKDREFVKRFKKPFGPVLAPVNEPKVN
jgi:hypothetical protein